MLKTTKPYDIDRQVRIMSKYKQQNVEMYCLFKKCLSEQKIYNGEKNRLKKFYNGIRKRSFYYGDLYFGHSLQEIPMLEKYVSQRWYQIADKIYKAVSKWPYEIKSGRRPANETLEYQLKMEARALATDLGTCGACHRYIEIENNIIYDHGHEIGHGYRAGCCVGSRKLPWERSTEGKEALIKDLKQNWEWILSKKPNETTVQLIAKAIETDDKKAIWLDRPFYRPQPLSVLLEHWKVKSDNAEATLRYHENLVKNWKPTQTLREKAQARKSK